MKFLRKTLRILGVFLLLLMVGCSVLKNIQDRKAEKNGNQIDKKEFADKGILLNSNTIFVEGKKLHYVQTGVDNAPTLLFIHGSPGNWKAFSEYLSDKELIKKYRLISIDRPGFGGSGYGEAMTVLNQCKLISLLIKTVNNNNKIIVIGHSLGGPIVAKLAEDNSKILSGIVVVSGSVSPELEGKESWRSLINNPILRFMLPTEMSVSNDEIRYFKKEVSEIANSLKYVKIPICVIHGDKDPLVPVGNAYFIQKENPDFTTLHIIKEANHFIPWTKKAFLIETITRFADSLSVAN